MADAKWGRCRACNAEFRLRKNGTIWPHINHRTRRHCDGSGQPPKEETPRG